MQDRSPASDSCSSVPHLWLKNGEGYPNTAVYFRSLHEIRPYRKSCSPLAHFPVNVLPDLAYLPGERGQHDEQPSYEDHRAATQQHNFAEQVRLH